LLAGRWRALVWSRKKCEAGTQSSELIRTLNEVYKWPFEEEAAKQFGRIRHELRSSGRIMQIVDIQLAAIAFAMGNCTVVSKDSDLSAVPGLQVGTGRRLNNLKGEKRAFCFGRLLEKVECPRSSPNRMALGYPS